MVICGGFAGKGTGSNELSMGDDGIVAKSEELSQIESEYPR